MAIVSLDLTFKMKKKDGERGEEGNNAKMKKEEKGKNATKKKFGT